MITDSPASAEEQVAGSSPRQVDSSGPAATEPQGSASPAEAAVNSVEAQQTPRPKIQVGRRVGPTSESPTGRATQADPEPPAETSATSVVVEAEGPVRPTKKVPPPSRRDPMTQELDAELNAALGNLSLDRIMTDGLAEQASQPLELDSRLRSGVVRIEGDHVFFALTGRNEGVCSIRAFKEPPHVGDQMDVVLTKYNAEDGLYEVAVPGASVEVSGWSDLTEGAIVEARITGANTGGLECMVNTIRGFIPASQIALFRIEKFGEYINQKLMCVVTEVNPRKKNLVLSHRALLERERAESRQKRLEALNVGDVCEGVVSSLRDFGAFVDLGGVDGLIHVSQLSWDHVQHPREVLQEGQKVRVKIEKINRQTGKISLTYRDLMDHPWTNIEQRFPVGAQVRGPVSRIAKFGAFVKLAPGVEGLIHISELAHQRIRAVGDVVKEGQEVDVKILSVDAPNQRIALSLKATLPLPEAAPEPEHEDEPPRELTVPKRKKPLRGGFDRPSGGESFGLKW